MDAATFINMVLTPIAGGIGAFFGLRLLQRRQGGAPMPRHQPLMIGVIVAAVLFALKYFKIIG